MSKGGTRIKREWPMLLKTSNAFGAGLTLAAIIVSFGAQSAIARPLRHHHHLYAMYRGPSFAPPTTLPYAPEYGFLRHVPPNATVGPGYTFVPGVGILGASCDLPTSACTNEYRDVQ
jgi:hypothetical protein